MLPEPQVCARARRARDPRFDGRFIIGVLTTGVYCRPICPARLPAEENVRYYPTAAAAQEAGFRPCLRCRPETGRRLPEWTLGSQTVVRGLRLIDGGYLDDHSVSELAAAFGLSTRHLNRLFLAELGASPKGLARTRRLQLAKRLIDDSQLSLATVAHTAGYGSIRRFNDDVKGTYGRPPSALRRAGRGGRRSSTDPTHGSGNDEERLLLALPVRGPYHASWVFDFLDKRALPGVETVDGLSYRRRLFAAGQPLGELYAVWEGEQLKVSLPAAAAGSLGDLLVRLRRVFDLDADPEAIEATLGEDERLRPILKADPGLRVPGAWDGFEIAVRAILGQQVSVARARDLAVALCERFGGGDFPAPAALVEADVSAIGMPGKRGEAVRALAGAALDGTLELHEGADADALEAALVALPGIGPWTAGYVSMRVARNPDGFPDADWVVLKMLSMTAARARRAAEAWRPWRAYAVMALWRQAGLARAAGAG